MSSTCIISPELSLKYVDPTPWIKYVELSPNYTMHANVFSFRLDIALLYPNMCLDAPLLINHVSSLVMGDPNSADTR